ncbi:adaptor protein MecA [Ornithinibacillus sp. 4-3]|uniref:Adapter protein MecA n=1 Tax=Ornithinibacillus sp. 4-3 TaxID=3231488 RepID=A0AB39HPN5_9BACI
MEIERINENTVKFYISYIDIEDRGFEREEIWYNRERGEQLFWQMMEELNYKEDFSFEGPLWIQVQALEKGLEVLVTRAQLSANGENVEIPVDGEKTIDIPIEEKIENMFEQGSAKLTEEAEQDWSNDDSDNVMWIVVSFDDFEDVIQLSHAFKANHEHIEESLYHFEDNYYLCIEFTEDIFNDDEQENIICQILEFANESEASIHVIEEYGKTIFEKDALTQVRKYFPA